MATNKRVPTGNVGDSTMTPAKVAARTTDSAPSTVLPVHDQAVQRALAANALAGAMPFNVGKEAEYQAGGGSQASEGAHAREIPAGVSASTLSEGNVSNKTGDPANEGACDPRGTLDRVRENAEGQRLTTNHGVPIADNQHSLKAGLRGPALLKDFILREKITHFDHERIPERIVHARGSAAHGFFEAYESLGAITRAAPFQAAGKRTPVFVRFSTVAGERGSKDTARDVRGFAVKFYTDEGNWDLVGNNIPVFFIQDAMKFPDLVHAVKPEPHHAMPQAASAHDTFWDFVSLMPESTHMLLWQMSDRAIPRSYRMMQGFGVHTFRFVNEAGESVLVKFHWTPKLGTHSLVWDEAVKISGGDPDFHRRDLWEAIEGGEYPEWELAVQVFTESQADAFSFDVLDATKLVPEELVPLKAIGRMVLDRNPDNFFAETEQVAFCTAHVIPGIDFTNDPLLAGRIHSYTDTQISRLGGPNFHEIPINAPLAPVHNNQRDGMHRQTIHRGKVSYEPNSLSGGCPFQAGPAGFVSFPEPVAQDELRGKREKFAEHFNQATLFYESQTASEQRHIVAAFRFELSKLTVPAIRERVLSMLANVSDQLVQDVAAGLGMDAPTAMPRALASPPKPEVLHSPALSLTARPGDGGVRTRKVAILVAAGVDGNAVSVVQTALLEAGALGRIVGPRVGPVRTMKRDMLDADASFENEVAACFDALVLPGGLGAIEALAADGRALEYVRDHYRHGKTILALGDATSLLEACGIDVSVPDPGIVVASKGKQGVAPFLAALSRHRHPERETDPPRV
ncbi:catalase [Dokdonella sp. MW10]|uniref:catalase n=1 Tax=Dokdonella sp. MW10 TaxID=2992926 RepID=UPI003F81C1ED